MIKYNMGKIYLHQYLILLFGRSHTWLWSELTPGFVIRDTPNRAQDHICAED